MCNKTYAKVLLVVMAMLDLVFVAFGNLLFLGCSRPALSCKLLPFCLFVISVACLVCIYVELNNGNPRLYTPYSIFVAARIVYTCVSFVIVLASLGSPAQEFVCGDCACECPNIDKISADISPHISPHDRESVMQAARWIALFALFGQLCWFLLTLTLIRIAVPDAMRFTRRQEPQIYEYQNPQYQAQV